MPVADWTVSFNLTSKVYTNNPSPAGVSTDPLLLNTSIANFGGLGVAGLFVLRPEGCSLVNQVRATKENVPQEDGAILHRRFTAGMEMTLAVQMWQDTDRIACDDLLQSMVDTMMGYAYGLLNAGDNEGRVAWAPVGLSSAGSTYRMLDDIRLLTYPAASQAPGSPYELTFTVDCELPYAEDLTQLSPSLSGGSGTVVNYGDRPSYPVWKIYGPYSAFVLTNTTTGDTLTWDELFPGAGAALTDAQYLEIDTFRNTVSLIHATTATGVNAANSATINVGSTSGWPTSGSFTMSGVTTSYTGIGATTLTGCGNHPVTAGGEVILNTAIGNRAAGINMTTSEFGLILPGSNAITVSYTAGNATNNNSSVCLINAAWA
jgi:hypothetical protein